MFPLAFYTEVLESLQRGYEEKIKGDNLVLEINSSKYAYNVSMKEVNSLVIKAMLSLPAIITPVKSIYLLIWYFLTKLILLSIYQSISGNKEYWAALLPIVKHFKPVLENYLKNNQSQLDSLEAMEEYGVHHAELAQAVFQALHFLYEQDVLSEEAILEWYENPPNDPSALKTFRKFVSLTSKFTWKHMYFIYSTLLYFRFSGETVY